MLNIDEEETVYVKRGRRYYPLAHVQRSWDSMKVGSYRLTYCPESGHHRYRYDVVPDTAAFMAAAEIARYAMEEAILERSKAMPAPGSVPYTEEQQRLIAKFRSDMAETGALFPTYWVNSTAFEIAQAAIDAVVCVHTQLQEESHSKEFNTQ